MPAYANLVTLLTAPADSVASLATVKQTVEGLSDRQQLKVIEEKGLLEALNPFLPGDTALAALQVLYTLTSGYTPIKMQCQAAVFDSLCFPSIKAMAATGSTLKLKQRAWATLASVSCMLKARSHAMLDSPGMSVLLQSGLKSADGDIAEGATIAINNLCLVKKTASAVLDDHPHLLQALVDTFSTSGFCKKFEGKQLPLARRQLLFLLLSSFL